MFLKKRNYMENKMSWYLVNILIAIVIASALFIFLYAYYNDFSPETLDSSFKAVGGSLVAIFFIIKGVWIEAPETKTIKIPVAFLHNINTGRLLSFSTLNVQMTSEEMDMFKGI